jgi:hypothetical protein
MERTSARVYANPNGRTFQFQEKQENVDNLISTRERRVSVSPENYHTRIFGFLRREAVTWLTLPVRGSVGLGAVLF